MYAFEERYWIAMPNQSSELIQTELIKANLKQSYPRLFYRCDSSLTHTSVICYSNAAETYISVEDIYILLNRVNPCLFTA